MRISLGTDVDRPPEVVWALLEQIDDHVHWMADAESITFRTAQHRGVGTEFVCRTRVGPLRTDDVMTVVEWEPPRTMGIVHRGAVSGTGRFTLAPSPGGRTRLVWEEELHFPRWAGGPLAARAAAPVLRRIWRGNLRRLGERAEAVA